MIRSLTRRLLPLATSCLVSALALTAVGCTGVPHFAVPESATEHMEPFDVDRHDEGWNFSWNEKLSFGPWHAHDIDRGWTKHTSSYFQINGRPWNIVFRNWRVFAIEGRHWAWRFGTIDEDMRPDVVRDYSFYLDSHDELAWGVQCGQELTFDWEALTCALRNEETEKVWILAIANQGDAEPVADWLEHAEKEIMTGTLSDGETTWEIVETFRLQNVPIASLEDPTGYYILRDGQLAGAVDLFAEGRVWLDDDGPREPRAAAAAALLLYRSLRAERDERLAARERFHRRHRS